MSKSDTPAAVPVEPPVRPLVERLREAAQGEEFFGFDGLRDEPDALLTESAAELERLGDLLGGIDSHGRYWVENRGRIIDAITKAGFDLMSDREHFWLSKKA